ncbi:MAG: TetR/AcrR family transcriptional regulator [Steroidobacteraceae bacterium]|jgi:AcrR family transcriptional regulator|nr:TetR/AcrR family transcriptional regulator [Steroidobacteraceae bacterium]
MGTARPAKKENQAPIDHRTLVGRRRRARTETKILEAALRIFAEKGPDAPVIDDFIKAAGIARGTFYNYFKSTAELLEATSSWLSDEIAETIEGEVRKLTDPVVRHCTGMRLWARKAEIDRVSCAFIARVWFNGGFAGYAPLRDIRLGMKTGGFRCITPQLGFDVSMGAMRQAMLRYMEDPLQKPFGDTLVRTIMQALGVDSARIDEMMSQPLPDISWPERQI